MGFRSHIARLCTIILAAMLVLGSQGHATAAKRIALVIGNDAYEAVIPLKKAVSDAKAMQRALGELGFTVIRATDVTRRQMNEKLQEFASRIDPGDVAMLFYAGHGIEISGENFLLPVDIPNAGPGQEDFVKNEAFGLNAVLGMLRKRGAQLNIVILDACRNNPFEQKSGRSLGASRGLARVQAPQGTFIMYSADAGEQALDRLGDSDPEPNSVFTRILIPLIKRPGNDLIQTAREVRRQVRKLARTVSHRQTPAYYDAVLGDFFFNGQSAEDPAATPTQDTLLSDYRLAERVGTTGAWDAFLSAHSDKQDNFYVRLAKAARQKLALGIFPETPEKPETAARKRYRPGQSFQDCPGCPEMMVIPAGSYVMGSPSNETSRHLDEGPALRVSLKEQFAVSRYEVTLGQFRQFVAETGHTANPGCWSWQDKWLLDEQASYRSPGYAQDDNHPVSCVNWHDARAYAAWVARKTDAPYRLLSETEWEYAARARSSLMYQHGDDTKLLCANANGADRATDWRWRNVNCDDGATHTARVGSYRTNSFGLHDMHGNLWEWVEDCYREDYAKPQGDTADSCENRSLRGGSWADFPGNLRAANRGKLQPVRRVNQVGIRIGLTLPAVK